MKLFLLLSFLLTVSCVSSDKTTIDPEPPEGVQPSPLIKLPIKVNSQAHFLDNKNIIYSTIASRPVGNFTQLFVYNLDDQKSRRITYQKANNYPQAVSDKKIYYVSDMHESKRRAFNKQSQLPTKSSMLEPPFFADLYSITQTGSHIKQYTNAQGYEGDLTILSNKNLGIYSRKFKGFYQLYRLNLKNNKSFKITQTKLNKRFPHSIQKNEKLVWVGYDSSLLKSQIYTSNLWGKKQRPINLPEGLHLHPQWHKSGEWLLFSSNLDDKSNFEIYAVRPDSSCLMRLTYKAGNDTFPKLGPKGLKLTFTNTHQSQQSLYITDFVPNLPCRK